MVYQIYYTPKDSTDGRRYIMFDIEYYMSKNEFEKNRWFSELHCLPCVEGITMFLKDKLNEKDFNHYEFINLGKEMEEMRGLLYERHDNKPKQFGAARVFHYGTFGKVLYGKLEAFAKKYDLHINID